jgi:hypothetical protein
VPALDEEPDELAGLVRRDAAGDPEEDARHRPIVPAARRPRWRVTRFASEKRV